jgi:hypothetical protein
MSHDGGGAGHHGGSAGHHGGNHSDIGYVGGSSGRRRNPFLGILRVAVMLAVILVVAYLVRH